MAPVQSPCCAILPCRCCGLSSYLAATFRVMDSLRIFDVIYATTAGGPDDATTNLSIMSYQYAFQWYQMGTGVAEAIVLLAMVVVSSYMLLKLWHRTAEAAAQ